MARSVNGTGNHAVGIARIYHHGTQVVRVVKLCAGTGFVDFPFAAFNELFNQFVDVFVLTDFHDFQVGNIDVFSLCRGFDFVSETEDDGVD